MSTSFAASRGQHVVATFRVGSGPSSTAMVSGVRESGCMIHADGSRFSRGDLLRLKLDEVGPFDARIALATPFSFVVDFVQPLHSAIAAMLAAR